MKEQDPDLEERELDELKVLEKRNKDRLKYMFYEKGMRIPDTDRLERSRIYPEHALAYILDKELHVLRYLDVHNGNHLQVIQNSDHKYRVDLVKMRFFAQYDSVWIEMPFMKRVKNLAHWATILREFDIPERFDE